MMQLAQRSPAPRIDESDSEPVTAAARPTKRTSLPGAALTFGRSYFALVALVLLVVVASFESSGFFTLANASNLLTAGAPEGVICVGMTLVIISGNFDLSVSGTYALGATVCAMVANHSGTPVALIVALLVGAGAGLVNGVLVGLLRMNSFIVTLGTGSAFAGIAYILTHDQSIIVAAPGFQTLGTGAWLGIPISIWLLAASFLLGGLVLRGTVYGYGLFSAGGNAEAARLAGLRVGALRMSTFVIVGALAALGGVIFTSELGVGQANIGSSTALDVIAIVVIGGTSLMGGEGGMLRTLCGFLLITVLSNLFNLLAVSSSVQLVVKGAVLVIAVSLDGTVAELARTRWAALRKSRANRRAALARPA